MTTQLDVMRFLPQLFTLYASIRIICQGETRKLMILNENVDRKIIPVAGGKGGVGKSVIAANMALRMSMFGKKTVLVDLDLGGSNLHTLLGMKNINPGIGNFVSGRSYSINELVCPTDWENLYFIPGDVLVYGLGELTKSVKSKIVKGLMDIDADYIIVDLGGGTNFTVVDFFLISNSGLIVTTPQTTSILNAYSFLKNYVFRFLQRAFASDKDITAYLKKILKERQPGERKTVTEMVVDIAEIDPASGEKAVAFLEVLQPKLILNKIYGIEDVSLAEGLRDLCLQNLSIKLECLGTIMNDEKINRSINLQRPFILDNEEIIATEEIHRVSQKIIQSSNFPEMPLELDYYADSFELAHIETENDLAALQGAEEEEPDSEGYDVEKLLELVRIQQNKIQELQGTLRMLSFNNG
jgi:flagellar biosynthesis protein FlhG